MTVSSEGPLERERRLTERHRLRAVTTIVQAGIPSGHYWSRDLGLGGLLLTGGPDLAVGTMLQVLLHFPWRRPIAIDARVVHRRSVSGEPAVGLAFEGALGTAHERLTEAIRRAASVGGRAQNPVVLVYSGVPDACKQLSSSLELLGRRPVFVCTPLDAIRWLVRDDMPIEAVVFDMASSGKMALDFLCFAAEEFPWMRRVAMAASNPRDPWLERLVTDAETTRLVNATLVSPWDPLAVSHVIAPPADGTLPAVPTPEAV